VPYFPAICGGLIRYAGDGPLYLLGLNFSCVRFCRGAVAALGAPSTDAYQICSRLHIYAALPPVVIKGALELMNSGDATYSCVLSHTFNGHSYRPVLGAASRLQ
jgi:hypothetical protein